MQLRFRLAAAVTLMLILSVGSFGCGSGDVASPSQDVVEFTTPDEMPEEVQAWIDDIEDSREETTDWMRYNDGIYVAVARGESPNPGHGVEIDEISYWHDPDEDLRIDVSATYLAPDPDEVYPQVIVYPVAVARFSVDDIPQVELSNIRFNFDIDDSEIASLREETHPVVLFFGTDDGQMSRTYRQIQTDELTPDIVAGEIMDGPLEERDEGYQRLLPEDTSLFISFDDDESGLAVVDFTEEIHGVGGSLGEQLALYSVVNTVIANFDHIDRVQIMVEGEEIESLGHLDLRSPLSFDDTLLSEDK